MTPHHAITHRSAEDQHKTVLPPMPSSALLPFVAARHNYLQCNLDGGRLTAEQFKELSSASAKELVRSIRSVSTIKLEDATEVIKAISHGPLLPSDQDLCITAVNEMMCSAALTSPEVQTQQAGPQNHEYLFNYLTEQEWINLLSDGLNLHGKLCLLVRKCCTIGIRSLSERTAAVAATIALECSGVSAESNMQTLEAVRQCKSIFKALSKQVLSSQGPLVYPRDPNEFAEKHHHLYSLAFPSSVPSPPKKYSAEEWGVLCSRTPCRNSRTGCRTMFATTNRDQSRQKDLLQIVRQALCAGPPPQDESAMGLPGFRWCGPTHHSPPELQRGTSTTSFDVAVTSSQVPGTALVPFQPESVGALGGVDVAPPPAPARPPPQAHTPTELVCEMRELLGKGELSAKKDTDAINVDDDTTMETKAESKGHKLKLTRKPGMQVKKKPAMHEVRPMQNKPEVKPMQANHEVKPSKSKHEVKPMKPVVKPMKPKGKLVLGCSKCRFKSHGCTQCKRRDFGGRRAP